MQIKAKLVGFLGTFKELRSVALIFSPLLARKLNGFVRILNVVLLCFVLPENGYLKNYSGGGGGGLHPHPSLTLPRSPIHGR